MSKQSLEEAVKLRNTAAYNLKVSVLSTLLEIIRICWNLTYPVRFHGELSYK